MRRIKYAQGFSLISLMVASAIGMFIIAVIIQSYVSSKMAFEARTAVSATAENGRFALADMRRTLIMTGRDISASKSAFAAVEDGGIEDGGTTDSDIIGVYYALGPSCGGAISRSTLIRFKVVDTVLQCEVDGTDYPLVSGIQLMRVLYGVDDDNDGFANRYLKASVVESEGAWDSVSTVRVGLVVSSDTQTLPSSLQAASAQSLNVLGQTFTAPDTSHVYRSVETTISLRNLNTIVQRQ